MTIAEKLTAIAANTEEVYKAGKKAEHDAFWDDFQEFGARTSYNNAFQNAWTDATFQPRYNIEPASAGYMFASTKITNLKNCLERNNVKLDTSNSRSLDYIFSSASSLTHCPTISTVSATSNSLASIFYSCTALVEIDKLILKDDGSQIFNENSFKNCTSLKEIRFEGVIGSDLDIRWSTKLSADSIESIITHLSTTVSAKLYLPTTAEANYDAEKGSGEYTKLKSNSSWDIKEVV